MSTVHVHVHVELPPALSEGLHQIHLAQRRIEERLRTIMATEAEVLAMLEDANTTTNTIAEDITRILAELANVPGVPQSVTDALASHVAQLKAVAAEVPPAGAAGGRR